MEFRMFTRRSGQGISIDTRLEAVRVSRLVCSSFICFGRYSLLKEKPKEKFFLWVEMPQRSPRLAVKQQWTQMHSTPY